MMGFVGMELARPAPAKGPGAVLELVRLDGPLTRSELAACTGLSLAAVAPRIDALVELGLLQELRGPSTGGRPASRIAFNPGAGVVLVADLGRTHSRLAVADLDGTPLAEWPEDRALDEGPEAVLAWALGVWDELLARAGRPAAEVLGVGIGTPGPVDFRSGTPVNPPVLAGWHGADIRRAIQSRHDVPVVVDNDANAEAIGEYRTNWRGRADDLLYVKCGTGIGCGVVVSGAIHRGAEGASGEIGHIAVSGASHLVCRCGNTGCLEAVASGRALAEQLRAAGHDVANAREVVALLRSGEADATRLVRAAGRALGEVLAGAVNLLNPAAIVVGGDLAAADEVLLAGVRELIYQRATVLATRSLRIERTSHTDRLGIIGAAVTVLDVVLAPGEIDRMVSDRQETA